MTKTKTSTSNRLSMQKLNKILDNQLLNINNIKIIIRYTDGIKAWEFTEEQISNRRAFLLELFKLCSFIKSELNNKQEQSKPILLQSISNYNPFTISDYTIENMLKTENLLSKQFKNTSIKIVA